MLLFVVFVVVVVVVVIVVDFICCWLLLNVVVVVVVVISSIIPPHTTATNLQGAHVTINARTDVDLDTAAILKQVAKSSGANYSVHKEKVRAEFANDFQVSCV